MEIGHTLHGNGEEKVIVLHDWIEDSTSYDATLPYLDTDNFTYALVDLRGYGKSKEIPGEYTVYEATADVIALADFLQWEKFHIVGHSMSGMITQRVAIEAKHRIKSVVALNPVPASGIEVGNTGWELLMTSLDEETRRRALNSLWGNRLSHRWLDFKLKRWLECSNPQAVQNYLKMFTETNFASEARGLATPFLVVVGEHDTEEYGIDAIKKTFFAWYPNVELNLCTNAAHYPMQETPVYLASTIESFMRRHC